MSSKGAQADTDRAMHGEHDLCQGRLSD